MNSDLSFSFVSRIHILNTHTYVYNERMFSNQYETVVGCGANTVTDALIYILMQMFLLVVANFTDEIRL